MLPQLGGGAVRAIVTGGAGFIGSHLVDALLARGDTVVCIDNLAGTGGSTRNIDHLRGHERFAFVEADITALADDAGFGEGADVLFHLAASKATVSLADPERDLRVNALGTLRLARAAAAEGMRFVHASTGSVTAKASYYGISKAAGEEYVRLVGDYTGMAWTALRYYHVIGPRQSDADTGGVVPIFLRRAREGRPLCVHGDGSQVRSFTSVHDVVRATILVGDEPQRDVLDCASGIRVSVRELAEFVISEYGGRIEYGPRRAGDVDEFYPDACGLRSMGVTFDRDWKGMVRAMVPGRAVAA